jgi:AraC-like DNA-binding protein
MLFSRDYTFTFWSAPRDLAAREASFNEPKLEVSVILEGKLTFFVDGRKRVIEGPCATFQACRKSLDVVTPAGLQVRTAWCYFSASELSSADWQSVDQLPHVQPMPTLLPSLFSSASLIPRIDDNSVGEPELNNQVRNALGATIFLEYVRSAKSAPVRKPIPSTVIKAKRVLDRDYAQSWTIEDLARVAGTNPTYLIHLFKKHIGQSPMRYLWNTRVDAGFHLLQTTSLTIEEISYRCGFQSAAHFSRRVKERKHVPPSLVRHGHQA